MEKTVVRFLAHFFFFTSAHVHLALVAASISHFLTAAIKSLCCSSTKKCLLCFFFSRSRSLSPFFSLSLAGLQRTFYLFSVFFLLYIPNLWTWQLIYAQYFRKHGYGENSCFPFPCSLNLQLSLLHKARVAIRFLVKITSSCIWVDN